MYHVHTPWMCEKILLGVEDERVSVLINENTHTWKVEAVHALFSDWEAAAICAIPLPPRPRADRLFWTETTSGLFTVKSAYCLQLQQRAQCVLGESSWNGKDAKFWKFLWSLSLPPKVKNFIWRACLGIIPTNELLWHRHMRKEGFCPVCRCEMESVVHALWCCSAANDVWLQSGLRVQKWGRLIHSFFDLMEFLQTGLLVDDALLFCCIAYFIWEQRNKVVFESLVHNPIMVVLRAKNLFTDYSAGCSSGGMIGRNTNRVAVVVQEPWKAPMLGWYKVNWAVHRNAKSGSWWSGILVRNHEGQVMAAKVGLLPSFPRGVDPGIGAMIQILSFGLEMGFLDVIIEGPSSFSPDAISKRQQQIEFSVQDYWVEDIGFLQQRFSSCLFSSSAQKSNKAAVALAKMGSCSAIDRVWLETCPTEIYSFL